MLLFAHLGLALLIARPFPRADLAFLALGSMLPDIIDKPLGTIIFGTPGMGRIFAHTLLFTPLWDHQLGSAFISIFSSAQMPISFSVKNNLMATALLTLK